MSELSDAALVTALRRQMTIAAARQVIAAGNLANVNTPGFRARQADFETALDASLRPAPGRDPPGPPAVGRAGSVAAKDADGLPARRDGNTVQIDRELLEMTSAAGEFQRAQTALAAKFRLVRYAINEGR